MLGKKANLAIGSGETVQSQEEADAMVWRFAFFGRGMCRMAKAAIAVNNAIIALV